MHRRIATRLRRPERAAGDDMSRREEVEASIHRFSKWLRDAGTIEAFSRRHKDLARTLADEVDALRGHRLALGKKTTRYENEREINAGLVADRDAIIDKLLAMLEPGKKPNYMDPKYNPSKMPPLTEYNLDCIWHGMRKQAHARACEIAGRKE
jgi:hypothetical protein